MPATIIRSSQAQGLTLLASRLAVADDGFVSISARWLAPQTGFSIEDLALDSPWPLQAAPLPVGMPRTQGGPFLIQRSVFKENGITYAETNYATAVFPLRIAESTSSQRASFNGYAEDSDGNSGSVSFDYHTVTRTFSYSTVGSAAIIQPFVFPQNTYNIRREGKWRLVRYFPSRTITANRQTLGRVSRFSITATGFYEQLTAATQRFFHDSSPFVLKPEDFSNGRPTFNIQ